MVDIADSSLFGPLNNKGANFWHTQVAKPDQPGTIKKNQTPGYGWRTELFLKMFPQPMVFPLCRVTSLPVPSSFL